MRTKPFSNNLNSISCRNNERAWRWFEKHGFPEHKGLVLHHIDMDLKEKDPERYYEWRIEDLAVMTKHDHMILHKTGHVVSQTTKYKMRLKKLGVPKTMEHRKKMSESHKLYWQRKKAGLC